MTIRRGVKWSDGKTMTPGDVKYSFDLAEDRDASAAPALGGHGPEERQGRREQRRLHVRREARAISSSTSTASTSRSSRSTSSRATARRRSRPATSRTGEDRRHRPVRVPVRASARVETVVWKKSSGLVGDEGARPQGRRRRTSSTSRTASNAAALANLLRREHRPLQQLRAEVGDQGQVQDLLQTRPRTTSARTRRGSSRTRRRSRSNDKQFRTALAYSINMNQILDKAYQGLVEQGEPDRPAADLEQVGRQEGRQAVRLLVQPDEGEGDPRRRRLQGHERRRVRREQGRVEDRPPDHLPERVVGLDDLDPGHRRQREGRRDQDHAGLPRVRDAGRRPRPRAGTTCSSATTGSTRTRRGRTTSTSSSCRSWRTRRPSTTSGTRTRRPGTSRKQLDKTPSSEHEGLPGGDVEAAEDVPAGSARDSALVQRHVVDGQHEVLDELAVREGRAVHAHLVAELLADDEHRHAHASEAGHGNVGRRRSPVIGQHPSRPPPGGVLSLCGDDPIGRSGEAIPRPQGLHLPRHVRRRGDDRLGDPALHAGRPDRAAPLADAGAAVGLRGADRLLHEGVRVRRPALEAVPQLLGRALPRRPRPEHRELPDARDRADPGRAAVHARAARARDPAQLLGREQGRRARGPPEGARQHRAPGRATC